MACYKVAELKEGTFKAFYDNASNRVNKKTKHEGFFELKKNLAGAFVGTLIDDYGVSVAVETIQNDIYHKILDDEWFKFNDFDVICEKPDDMKLAASPTPSTSSSLKMATGFVPANRLKPYERSPASKSPRRPLISYLNRGPVKSEDGYFSTYAKKEEMLGAFMEESTGAAMKDDSSDSADENVVATVQVSVSAPHALDESGAGFIEGTFWNQSVVEKSQIPKAKLLEIAAQYPNDNKYVAGVFDGLVLGGHRLIGIHDYDFVDIVEHMRQL